MYDYQKNNTSPGCNASMVPDVIEPGNTNFCNTKPPMSAWALLAVARASRDLQSAACALLPSLDLYRSWWLQHRVTASQGSSLPDNEVPLLQFGATDNRPECMKWESGMDNAPRFDFTKLKLVAPGTFLGDQFSVDLAAHSYGDWMSQALLADMCGAPDMAARLRADAAALQTRAQAAFFSNATGFMHDLLLTGTLLRELGRDFNFARM